MIFKPELAALILDGSKTVTRRRAKIGKPCRYRAGRSYSLQVEYGTKGIARIGVLDVSLPEPVGRVDRAEAKLEGLGSVADFIAYWMTLYGSWDPMVLVHRIEFQVVHPDDYALWESGSAGVPVEVVRT